jgi:hypothetical protein
MFSLPVRVLQTALFCIIWLSFRTAAGYEWLTGTLMLQNRFWDLLLTSYLAHFASSYELFYHCQLTQALSDF